MMAQADFGVAVELGFGVPNICSSGTVGVDAFYFAAPTTSPRTPDFHG
jgi:hypothetical protein